MKLSKEQALELVKILTLYKTTRVASAASSPDAHGLCTDLEEYVLGGDAGDEEGDQEVDADEQDEDEEEDVEEDEAGNEEDQEGVNEGEDAGEEVDESSGEDDEVKVEGERLHDLKPVRVVTGQKGALLTFRFDDDEYRLDLHVDGKAYHSGVTHLQRFAASLDVETSDNRWHQFAVSKFPKGWATTLPLNVVCKVV